MAGLELVVLDFDGTFTRVDDEAAPFLEAYRAGLGAILGFEVQPEWERAHAIIEADPDQHGWQYEGRIVAPSHADPYILATTIAQILLGGQGPPGSRSALAHPPGFGARLRERQILLREHHGELAPGLTESLYREAYACAGTVFREDAREVVEALLELGLPVYVVTNSHTADVARKLARLDARGGDGLAIRGDACKWMLVGAEEHDPRFEALPEALRVPGLGRPMFLRRGRYFDALRRIWTETGACPETTLVCGDIYELDLALPARLGARVHMIGRPSTPAYERDAVRSAGGTFSTDLAGVLSVLARA